VWISGPDEKIVSERNPLLDIYASVIEDIDRKVCLDDFAGAQRLIDRLNGISALESEVGKLKKKMNRKATLAYLASMALATISFSAVILPILYRWRSGSFHVQSLLLEAGAFNVVAGIVVGSILRIVQPKVLRTTFKRILGGFVATIAVLLLVYGVFYKTGFDPAHRLDEQQMLAEYQQHFPFGMRTLANQEDIDFLRGLIKKYTSTGVDLTVQRKNLIWLQDKINKDKAMLNKVEQTRKKIERIQRRY
jgi:hypothetical protein